MAYPIDCNHLRSRQTERIKADPRLRLAITRVEVIAILVALCLGLSLLYAMTPHLNPCRELSKRLVCASNLKGIGTTCKIYANENGGRWPTPAFDESLAGAIDYRVAVGSGVGDTRSPSLVQSSTSGPNGASQLSASRALWMLVRSGDITTKQFVCPQSKDTFDGSPRLESYYDFSSRENLSYGFQLPFGPERTRAHDQMDNRMVLAADKGPYLHRDVPTPAIDLERTQESQTMKTSPTWTFFNSQNHSGEGQNALFADGHANFHRVPTVGVDYDNIYTVALGNESEPQRVVGENPWARRLSPFSPRDAAGNLLMSTDSLIFP